MPSVYLSIYSTGYGIQYVRSQTSRRNQKSIHGRSQVELLQYQFNEISPTWMISNYMVATGYVKLVLILNYRECQWMIYQGMYFLKWRRTVLHHFHHQSTPLQAAIMADIKVMLQGMQWWLQTSSRNTVRTIHSHYIIIKYNEEFCKVYQYHISWHL